MEDLENSNMDYSGEETPPPEESSNRTFLIVAGVLGGITILALACIAAYAFFVLPSQRRNTQATAIALTVAVNDMNTAVARTALAAAATPTFTNTPPPTATTAVRTSTPVLAVATDTPVPSADPRTATVAALLTQAAATQSVATSTALPTTGFAEDVGIPGMLGMALLLVVVIFLARRLRSA